MDHIQSPGGQAQPKLKKYAVHALTIACRYAGPDGIFYLSKEGIALTLGIDSDLATTYKAIKWALDNTLKNRGIVKPVTRGVDWRRTKAGEKGQGPVYQLLMSKEEVTKAIDLPISVPCPLGEVFSLSSSIEEVCAYLADIIGELPAIKRKGKYERGWFNKPEHVGRQKASNGRYCVSRGIRTWVVWDRKYEATVSLKEFISEKYGIDDFASLEETERYLKIKASLDEQRAEVWAVRDTFRQKDKDFIRVITGTLLPTSVPCSYGEVFSHRSQRYQYEPPGFVIETVGERMRQAIECLLPIDPDVGNDFINNRYADPAYRHSATAIYYAVKNKSKFYQALGYHYSREHWTWSSFDGTKKVVMPRGKCIATPLADPKTNLYIGFEVRALDTGQKIQIRCPEYHDCKVVTNFLHLDRTKPVLLIESASDAVVTPNSLGACGKDNLKALAGILTSHGLQVIIAPDADYKHQGWLDAYPHYRWTSTDYKDFSEVTAAGYDWDEFIVLSTPTQEVRAAA